MSSRTAFTCRRRFLSGALAILAATSLIGVYAAFTESISTQTQNITTGSGSLVLTAGSLRTTLTSSVSDLVPGDWVTRPVTITNQANYDMSAVSLSVGDSFPGAAFTSDPEGLKLTVEEESTPGSGSWSTIYGPSAPTGNVIANIGGGVLTAGGSTSLRVTQTFVGPNTSKSLKGAEADLTYVFNGTQRAAFTGVTPQTAASYRWLMDSASGSTGEAASVGGIPLHGNEFTQVAGIAPHSTSAMEVPAAFSAQLEADLPSSATAGAFTLETWVKLSSFNGLTNVLQIGDCCGGNILLRTYTDGTLHAQSGSAGFNIASAPLPANVAHPVVLVVTPQSGTDLVSLYIDGVLSVQTTATVSIQTPSLYGPLTFSSSDTLVMDDTSFYTTVLSDTEIAEHATDGVH